MASHGIYPVTYILSYREKNLKEKVKSMTLLSIGMIVKNEAKKLEQTLQALQPLREAISCQLIIADTGSEDETPQIAQRYADEFFTIVWEDDFAKARNATLKQAKGDWFFYLDADEVMEDAEELINFLHNPKSQRFNSIKILIRNMTSYKNMAWQDFWSARIFRRHKEVFFRNAIHESVPTLRPSYVLEKTRLIHSGYNNDDVELMERKSTRNFELINKCLAVENDLFKRCKLHLECADSIALINGRDEEVQEQTKLAIDLLLKFPVKAEERIYMLARAYSLSLRIYYNREQWQKCLDAGEEYFENQPVRCYGDLDIRFVLGDACGRLKRYEEAIEHLETYLYWLDRKQEDIIIASKYMVLATVSFQEKAKYYTSWSYRELGDKDNAWKYAQQIKSEQIGGMDVRQYQWQLALSYDTAKRLPVLWDNWDETVQQAMLAGTIEAVKKFNEERKNDIAVALRLLGENDQRVLPVLALYTSDSSEVMEYLSQIEEELPIAQSDILYQCLRLNIPLALLIRHINQEFLENYINTCATHHPDMAQYVCRYCEAHQPEQLSLAELRFAQFLLCHNLFCTTIEDDWRGEIWSLTLHYALTYMKRIYNEEALLEVNQWLLSPLEQFILLAERGERERRDQQYAQALASYRKGLVVYPKGKDVADMVLEEIEEAINPAAMELKQLAKAVKGQIKEQLELGNCLVAQSMLEELRSIVPDDKEVLELLEQTTAIEPQDEEVRLLVEETAQSEQIWH